LALWFYDAVVGELPSARERRERPAGRPGFDRPYLPGELLSTGDIWAFNNRPLPYDYLSSLDAAADRSVRELEEAIQEWRRLSDEAIRKLDDTPDHASGGRTWSPSWDLREPPIITMDHAFSDDVYVYTSPRPDDPYLRLEYGSFPLGPGTARDAEQDGDLSRSSFPIESFPYRRLID
jgi:hypothetical protein